MLRKLQARRFLAIGCVFACACSAEMAPPSTRGGGAPAQSAATPSSNLPSNATVGAAAGSSGGFDTTTTSLPSQPMAATPTAHSDKVCDAVQLTTNPQIIDMMIVLDRSGSMDTGKRWDPSVAAVRKITMELESQIDFGLAIFPDDSPPMTTFMTSNVNGSFSISIGNESVCNPGKVVVPIAAKNASAIGMRLDMTRPAGGTPTSDTLMKLVDTFAATQAGPDQVVHPKYVLLVTDGAPTCPSGGGKEPANQADIDASNAAVEALASHGVKTYVIGYDTTTPGNEMLAQVLDGFAQRGGTGEQHHRPVEDEASLTAAFEAITSSAASCVFKLDQAPPRPDYVLVKLDGKQLNLNMPDGWKLDDDQTVEITGAACTMFKSGKHVLDATVQCDVVQPS